MRTEQNKAVFRRVFAVIAEKDSKQRAWMLAQDWAHQMQVPLQEISLDDQVLGDDPWVEEFQPNDLFVCGPDVPSMYKKNLLRETQRKGAPALMLCSQDAVVPTRILLIDQGGPWADNLVGATAKLCEIFRAGLVALTVARTEREARQRQQQARETLQGWNVQVNFDFLAGAEVRSAIASVARWRRCQLVVLEPGHASPWARWLGSAPGPWVMDLLESLSFLLIPSMKPTVLTRNFSDTTPVPPGLPRRPSLTSASPRGKPLVAGKPAEPLSEVEAGRWPKAHHKP